jgi:hypothetical protein
MLNETGTGYEAYTDFRARRDERGYTILQHISNYAELQYAAGQIDADVLGAVQIDVVCAHLSIDVARQEL